MKRIDSGANHVRYAVGDLTVVALRDGYVDMPASRLRQPGDRPFGTDLPAEVELVDGKLRLSVNAFLIIDGGQYILIDTGAANAWLPKMGALLRALEEAGVSRDRIGTVALTHTHEDHVHGLVAADGSDAFPNLQRLFIPKEEISMFDGVDRMARYRQRRLPIADGFKLSANVIAVEAHGHEIGHTAYQASSGGDALLIWGDVIHVPSIQFTRPEIAWAFDANQDEARETRQRMLRRASQPNVFVGGGASRLSRRRRRGRMRGSFLLQASVIGPVNSLSRDRRPRRVIHRRHYRRRWKAKADLGRPERLSF
jgi:glyoxylase-like metal-dependent hydrolase (beta-lactamase superfamily II)